MDNPGFEDLYDIEQRPGAGVRLWTQAVRMQLERVRETCGRHRFNQSEKPERYREDADAEWQLHAEVYFLASAVNRVRLFHDLVAKHIQGDARLRSARQTFDAAAPTAKLLRDFYEHLDEYLVDSPKKHRRFPGRASPVLHCIWDGDNVSVAFGPERLDITLAAVAAIQLGDATHEVWEDNLDRARPTTLRDSPPDPSAKGTIEVTMGVSTVIGRDGEYQKMTGTLVGVEARPEPPSGVESDAPRPD